MTIKKSLEYIEQAIDIMPADPVLNSHFGDVLWHSNRKTEARYQWERAMLFNPDKKTTKELDVKLKNGL